MVWLSLWQRQHTDRCGRISGGAQKKVVEQIISFSFSFSFLCLWVFSFLVFFSSWSTLQQLAVGRWRLPTGTGGVAQRSKGGTREVVGPTHSVPFGKGTGSL